MHDGNARLGIRPRRRETEEGKRISRDQRENDPMSASAGFFAPGARVLSLLSRIT